MVAREVVDGGAYGLELVKKVVRHWAFERCGLFGALDGGGEVVERENVGGHHGHQEKQVQTHSETHFALSISISI